LIKAILWTVCRSSLSPQRRASPELALFTAFLFTWLVPQMRNPAPRLRQLHFSRAVKLMFLPTKFKRVTSNVLGQDPSPMKTLDRAES